MAITANKVAGIRAAVVSDCFSATMAREHNNANILCLGQRVLGDELAKMLVQSFLRAEFAGGRHARRVAKIDAAGGS
jgi:ribose 5-phosphate isomerase B